MESDDDGSLETTGRRRVVDQEAAAALFREAAKLPLADETTTLVNLARQPDLVHHVLSFLDIIVPDDEPTLAAALRRAGYNQRVLLRSGEHCIEHEPSTPISRRRVWICGEPGAIVRGTLVLGTAGGTIERVRLDDAGDCCLRATEGRWRLERVRLRCSHGSAIFLSGGATLELSACRLGGESEQEMGKHVVMLSAYGSVQVHGTAKRSSYAAVLHQRARLLAEGCRFGVSTKACGRPAAHATLVMLIAPSSARSGLLGGDVSTRWAITCSSPPMRARREHEPRCLYVGRGWRSQPRVALVHFNGCPPGVGRRGPAKARRDRRLRPARLRRGGWRPSHSQRVALRQWRATRRRW